MTSIQSITAKEVRESCKKMLQNRAIAGTFTLKHKQVCLIKGTGEDRKYISICDPFEVLGRTYDTEGGGTGLVLRFAADRVAQPIVETTVLSKDLISDPKKVVSHLADEGLWISGNRDAIAKVGELMCLIRPEMDIVTVSRPGWHGCIFASPTGEIFGAGDLAYRLANSASYEDPAKLGELAGWKNATHSALACANGDFLCVGLLSGFAGPLVNLMEEQTSPILNFAGTTSRGKSTAQRLGASVWGSTVRGAALVKFNVTPNAVEAIAERASGTLLAIDEGGQSGLDGKAYQKAVFDLAEGVGKRRLTAAATERKVRRWSTCITISEEIGFADKVKRDGRNAAAGAVARCWEIDVDDAAILDAETLNAIDGIKRHYGHAGPVFIEHLVNSGVASDPVALRVRVSETEEALSEKSDSPQARRVASAAAIVLTAGELAQEAGIIRQDYDVAGAVKRVLDRSKARMAQDMDPLATALSNLQEGVIRRCGVDVVELHYEPDHQNREVIAYFGYPDGENFTSADSDRSQYERVYFIPADQMFKLGGGNVTASAMAKVLKKEGFLVDAPGNNNQWSSVPEIGQIKNYRVRGTFFHEVNNSDYQRAKAVAA